MESTLIKTESAAIKTVPDTILKFRKVGMKDLNSLMHFIADYPSRSCDFSIGGILLWTDYFNYEICVIDDTLFLKGSDERGVFFHQPLGHLSDMESLPLIKEYCDAYGISSRIITPQECAPENIDECAMSHPAYLPDWREYVYNIEQFLKFSGKKMEKKRNHLNYFMNHYTDYEMEILDGSQTDELTEFNDKFNLYHKDGDTFDYESSAIGKAIENYNLYPFFGLLIRYEGKIIGYTFGEAVGDTFIIHAEKGDIEYRGVYQALSSLLSREIQKKYPEINFLNREDDMGNEYLRQSKLSYHPTKFIAKWEISA
ncbi:MAG: phosphatidylglycerol lysyltransferase domain-containing protein [Muribaculaceae bacterium]|nr:phosphatidylglycerol lysyltransferase domain-containing protein [Muribaculaceae bacterium]